MLFGSRVCALNKNDGDERVTRVAQLVDNDGDDELLNRFNAIT